MPGIRRKIVLRLITAYLVVPHYLLFGSGLFADCSPSRDSASRPRQPSNYVLVRLLRTPAAFDGESRFQVGAQLSHHWRDGGSP